MQKGTEYLAITPSPLKRNQRVNHPALSKVAIVTKINKLINNNNNNNNNKRKCKCDRTQSTILNSYLIHCGHLKLNSP